MLVVNTASEVCIVRTELRFHGYVRAREIAVHYCCLQQLGQTWCYVMRTGTAYATQLVFFLMGLFLCNNMAFSSEEGLTQY